MNSRKINMGESEGDTEQDGDFEKARGSYLKESCSKNVCCKYVVLGMKIQMWTRKVHFENDAAEQSTQKTRNSTYLFFTTDAITV